MLNKHLTSTTGGDFTAALRDGVLSERELGWIAGIVDGEGCISIIKYSSVRRATPNYVINVSVASAKYSLLLLEENFGGKIRLLKHDNPKHADQFKWEVGDKIALRFLLQIKLYLRWKTEQADLCINLQKRKTAMSVIIVGGRKVPALEVAAREALYQQVKRLNAKGPQ